MIKIIFLPYTICHIKNLEMISYIENTSKHVKCSITLEELLTLIEKHNDKN